MNWKNAQDVAEIPLGLKNTSRWAELILFVKYCIPFRENMYPVIHKSHSAVYGCFSQTITRVLRCFPFIFNKYHEKYSWNSHLISKE